MAKMKTGGTSDLCNHYDNLDYEAEKRDDDVLEALMEELKNLNTMTGPMLAEAISVLPVPQAGTVPGN
jgi:hypothetical protein